MKKRGALSLWKAVLLVFASFVGVGGATALTLYLTGQFNEKIVEPENMIISQSVEGEGLYNEETGRFEISGNSQLIISTTTEDVTKKKVSLSFENGVEYEKLSNGKITDGNIIIPQTVYLNSKFDIEINQQYNSTLGVDWPVGGVSKIIAVSESNDKIENKTFTIAVDVPVEKIELTISGREQSEEVQEIVIGSIFEVETVFSPLTSSYLYNDSTKTKNVYLTAVGSGITYDEETGKFVAASVTSEFSTVTAYVFRTAYEQEKYFSENQNATSDQIIAYLKNNTDKSKNASLNIKVVPVSVDEVDFTLAAKTVTTSVDKNCKIRVNSSTGDKNLGVSIKDSEGNSLPSLYNNVGLKILSDLEGVTIKGGDSDYDSNGDHKFVKVMVVTNSGISIEKYNRNKTYISDDNKEYYILPDTKPTNPGDYYWNISSTEIVEGNVGINFFYKDKNGVWKKYFEEDKTFVLSITGNSNETAIGWVYGHEGTIALSMTTDNNGKQSGKPYPLGNEVNEVEESNTYKLYRFFLYVEEGSELNVEELFEVEQGETYETFLNGDPISVDGIVGSYTLYELKNHSTSLQAKRSFDGKVKFVAAIIRTDADGNVYPGKYQIVNISRSRDVTVEGILSISQFEGSTFEIDENIEKSDNGKYYIPSVSKDNFGQDKSHVTFVLNVSSNDPSKDAEKVLKAFENGNLTVVCLDENDNVNTQQYAYLKNLKKDTYQDGTEREDRFVGEIIINSSLITEENGLDGLYVGLQLQYNDGVETRVLTLEQEDLNKCFYVYRQIPETFKTTFEDVGVNPTGTVFVSISESEGVEIEWQQAEGDLKETLTKSEFEELLKVEILDQKGNKINEVDGLYKVSYIEVDAYDNVVTTDNIISVASNGQVGFKTTNGQERETYLKILVEDATIEEGEEVQERISLSSIKFNIKSEGVSEVRYDDSTEVGASNLVVSNKLNEITVKKYVQENDEIELDNLFDVTLSNGNTSTNYKIYLDSTFVSSFSSRSKDLLMMIEFNDDGFDANRTLSDYSSTEIEKVIIKNVFNQDTTIKFVIRGENSLYDIVLNLTFLRDIDVSSFFEREMQNNYSKYLAKAPGNSNAISIFADETYNLDDYLGFTLDKYRWSKLANVGTLSSLIDTNGIDIATLESDGTNVSLKIKQVYSLTYLTVKIYYGVQSAYAFSVTLAFYINPNIIAVQSTESAFVDLSKIDDIEADYKVSTFYKFYKLTSYLNETQPTPFGNNFKVAFGTTSQYISVDNSIAGGKIIYASSSDVFEYNGQQLLQTIYVLNTNDDTRVDFVLKQGNEITVPTAENAVLYVSLGYYDGDEVTMIKNILKVWKNENEWRNDGVDITENAIVTYNGKTTLLLMQEEIVETLANFTIESVSSTECFSVGNGSKYVSVKSIVQFVYFEEEITLLLTSSPAIRITIPVIVTKVSDRFVNYTNEDYKDLAILLGDVELQEEDVYEELEAGKTYQILTNDSVAGGENNIGFHYDKNSAYGIGNNNNPVVAIVDLAQGYKEGVATLTAIDDGYTLTLADVATSDETIYVVLRVTYSDISGTITYDCFYRIKVVPNIENGQTNYPYAEDAEYLDSISSEITKTYTYDAEENKYTINLSQVFDGYTIADGKERFEISAPRLASEFESEKTYYMLNSETNELEEVNIFEAGKYYFNNGTDVVLANEFDAEQTYYVDQDGTQEIVLVEFEAETYYTFSTNPNAVSYFEESYSISKIYVDGIETPIENAYITCSIGATTLEIVVSNNARKYDVVVEKKYYSNNSEIINANLYYTFKINQSSNYTYSITADGTSLTPTNGVFTYDIDAGSDAVHFVPKIFIDSNGTQTPVENFTIVYEENTDLAGVVKNENNEIEFTPQAEIAREGKIAFYAYTDEKMVFKFVVNVNSFYKFSYVSQNINSGAKYEFVDLFKLINSKEEVEENKDVTNSVTISQKDASKAGAMIDNNAQTIEFAYLTEDAEFVFEGTIAGYTFEFTILAQAKSPLVANVFNDGITHYGNKPFTIGVSDIIDCFDSAAVADYLSVEGAVGDVVTITPANVSNDETTVRMVVSVRYHWEGLEDRIFDINYNYIVNKNVNVEKNLPKPDGENEIVAEYIKNGTSFRFSEAAEFADGNRIVVTDVEEAKVAGAVAKTYSIEILESENVTVSGLTGEIALTTAITVSLTNSGSNGSVAFRVTVNNVAVTYNMVVISGEVVRVVTNATNYVEAIENIYVEDIASYEDSDLFATDRILNMTFSSNVNSGTTYYIRTRNEGQYKIYAVEAKASESANIDLGKSCPNIEYLGTFSTEALANDFEKTGIEGLYTVEPNVRDRIMFRYADGTTIANLSATVKDGNNDFDLSSMELNTPVSLKIYRSDESTTQVGTYKLQLSIEFDVIGDASDYASYTLKTLQANNENISLLSMEEFGITNTRKNTLFTKDMLENSKASLGLKIYGIGTEGLAVTGNTKLEEFNENLGGTGLKPNATQEEIDETPEGGNLYNYITINGVKAQNSTSRVVDWYIVAQGADNIGNHVMMRLTYSVVVGTKPFEKSFNILFKVEDNSTILFNTYDEGIKHEYADGIFTVNTTNPIVVESSQMSEGVQDVNIHEVVTAYMYGNTIENQIADFGFKIEVNKKLEEETYNTGSSQIENVTLADPILTFTELSLGTKYFFVEGTNGFGYKIGAFFKLVGTTNPVMTMSTASVDEEEEIGFALAYTQVVASTLTPVENGDTYQTFTNDNCIYKPGSGNIYVKCTAANVLIQQKEDGTGYNINGENFTVSKFMVGVPINSTNSSQLTELTVEVYRLTDDTSVVSGKTYYSKSGDVFSPVESPVNTNIQTYYERYIFRPTYTASSTVSPAMDNGASPAVPLKTAVFTNIPAYAFSNNLVYFDTKVIADNGMSSSNKIGDWKVKKIELIKDGITIGTTTGDAKLCTDSKMTFFNGTNAVGGTTEHSGLKIPRVEGYYFGTGNTIAGVTMRVTLSNGDKEATFDKTLQINKKANGFTDFKSTTITDNSKIETNENVNNLFNDTLEIVLGAGESVKFTLSATVNSKAKTSDTISITNNKSYAVTEYVSINANLNAGVNLHSGDVAVTVTEGSASFKYNGGDAVSLSKVGETNPTTNITLAKYSSITLNINNIKELPTTLSVNSAVSKTLYFVYMDKDTTSNTEYYYQTAQTFSVKPTNYTAKAGTNNRISAAALIEENYYVIPFADWAGQVVLDSDDTKYLSNEYAYKYIFEINNSDEGGSGNAFIDENGHIITNEDFIALDQTVTVNVYVKVSGNDGNYSKEEGILIGQFRISIGGTSTNANDTIQYNSEQQYGEEQTKYVYSVGSTVSLKELFDNNETSSTHYHVVKVNGTEYVRNNLDSWTFETEGTHEVYIVKTTDGIVETTDGVKTGYMKVTFIIYDTTTSTEKIVFVDSGSYPYSESNVFKIDGNTAVTAGTEDFTGKTGKVNVTLVETNTYTLCKYSFYILEETKEAKVGKIQTGSFTLANLDSEATEFYRVTRNNEEEITSITQLRTETSVTTAVGSQTQKEYLALNSDGTYTLWNMTYYIIPNVATQNYALLAKDTAFKAAIGATGAIYKIDNNGILTELSAEEKAADDLVQLKTVIVNDSSVARNTYNFTVYKASKDVVVEAEAYSSNNLLSNLLDDAVVAAIEGVDSASITYYAYNSSNGTKTQVVFKSFENIPIEGITETYYAKVNNDYYLINATFKQTGSLSE